MVIFFCRCWGSRSIINYLHLSVYFLNNTAPKPFSLASQWTINGFVKSRYDIAFGDLSSSINSEMMFAWSFDHRIGSFEDFCPFVFLNLWLILGTFSGSKDRMSHIGFTFREKFSIDCLWWPKNPRSFCKSPTVLGGLCNFSTASLSIGSSLYPFRW